MGYGRIVFPISKKEDMVINVVIAAVFIAGGILGYRWLSAAMLVP